MEETSDAVFLFYTVLEVLLWVRNNTLSNEHVYSNCFWKPALFFGFTAILYLYINRQK